jgi:hypothetical protein
MSSDMTINAVQTPAAVAVVVPTILRNSLLKAVRSVYTQNFEGRIHVLIGVDVPQGDVAIVETLRTECPSHVSLTIVDPGYSTSRRHGGFYSNYFGGSLRTVLSYLANSRYVAYLDDNDWFAANHLATLRKAIEGHAWAWAGRWMVHPTTLWPICRDEWDSVGPGRGINAQRFGGFVQPSGLMMDKDACHFTMPLWSLAAFPNGTGEDRLIFDQLNKKEHGAGTGQFTSFCTLSADALRHDHHMREFQARGLRWMTDDSAIARINALLADAIQYGQQNDWDGVDRATGMLLSLQPHHAQALFLSARARQAKGNHEEATQLIAHAIEVDDTHPDWFDTLANLLETDGRVEGALRIRAAQKRRFNR